MSTSQTRLDGSLAATGAFGSSAAQDGENLDEALRVVALSEDLLCTTTFDGHLIRVNPSWERVLGFSAAELCGQPLLPFIHPEDRDDTLEAMASLTGGAEVVKFVNRYQTKDGRWRWIEWRSVGVPERETIYGCGRDVTERVESERAQRYLAMIVEQSEDAIIAKDLEGRVTQWNRGAERMYGYSAPEVLGQPIAFLVPSHRAGEEEEILRTIRAGKPVSRYVTERLHKDGATLKVSVTISPIHDAHGRVVGASAISRDVSEKLAMEHALRVAEERFRKAFDEAPIGMALLGVGGEWLRVNHALCQLLGYSEWELLRLRLQDLTHADDLDEDLEGVRRMLNGEIRSFHLEQRSLHRDGHSVWTNISFSLVRDDEGTPAYFITQIEDVSARRRVVASLAKAEERLRTTVEHAPIGVALLELSEAGPGRVLSANPALCNLLGYSSESLMEMALSSVVYPDDLDRLSRDLKLLASHDEARIELEVRCLHAEGQMLWIAISGASAPNLVGGARMAVCHLMDVSDRKRFEGQLQYLADHDALTGLFNRRRFEEELVRAVAHANRYGKHGALLMIDLDGFKYVNDSLGHARGDELITRIGALLADVLRETDVLARLGGDEFAVILPEADAERAEVVSGKVLEALDARAVALSEDRNAHVTASIGITTFGPGAEQSAEDLMVEADIAMYEAKERGKHQAALYERDLDHHSNIIVRQSWMTRLKDAIERDQFELMAQPVTGICCNGIARYELLLRMRGDDGELIPPGTFLYIAERFDLIQQIDRWVFAEAAKLLALHDRAGQDVSLSVNMSAKTLVDPRIINDLAAVLSAYPVRSDRLVVEVTETAAIVNIDKAQVVARGLRDLGCRFALDDFGAGFASFYYLKHLDFDFLKIDGEFIKALPQNRTDQLVVQSVVEVARGLGAQTIAEFVGDEMTIRSLRGLGVDYGQGYHLGQPEPVAEILPALCRG